MKFLKWEFKDEEIKPGNKSLIIYLLFLTTEVPSILQIITFLGFLLILMDNYTFRTLTAAIITVVIVCTYLTSRGLLFLDYQIKDKSSVINRSHLAKGFLVKRWIAYNLATSAFFGSFLTSLSFLINTRF